MFRSSKRCWERLSETIEQDLESRNLSSITCTCYCERWFSEMFKEVNLLLKIPSIWKPDTATDGSELAAKLRDTSIFSSLEALELLIR